MKRHAHLRREGLIADESGTALAEFAITSPIILFFFLMMLQFLQIVRASQHVNYAAYAAARAYAVHGSVDSPSRAQEVAEEAAAVALAPVARLIFEELPLADLVTVPQGLPEVARNTADFLLGYVGAKVRLNRDNGLGGSVEVSVNGSPAQVDVLINYPQPIFIPGLVDLWAYIRPGESAFGSLKPLRQGLGGIPGRLLPVAETLEKLQTPLDGAILAPGPVPRFVMPYVNVTARCSVGYSDWGHKNPEYRPRLRNTVKDAKTSSEDEQKMNDAAQTKDTMDQHAQEMVVEKKACGHWRESQQAVADALTRLNAVNSDPAATAADRQLATQQLDSARRDERAAQAAYQAAHAQRMATQRQVENTVGKDLNYEVECN